MTITSTMLYSPPDTERAWAEWKCSCGPAALAALIGRPCMDLRPHSHADFDQLALILEGEADYYVDDVPHRMTAGSMLLVPAGAEHYIKPLTEPCINLDVFAPPREDYADIACKLTDVLAQ